MHARRSLFSTLAVLLITSPALSAAIAIPNYDFASPNVFNAPPYAVAGVSDWVQSPPPAGWTGTAQGWEDSVGVFLNVPYEWIDNLVPSGGTAVHQQAAFMFSAPGLELSQTLSTSYQVGQSYQLTVGIEGGGSGMPLGVPMQIELYYLDGSGNQIPVGTTTVLNDLALAGTGDYISHLPDRVLTIPAVAAGDAWAGKNIGVALLQISGSGNTGYWDIDNVRLASIPTAVWTGAAVGNMNWSNPDNWGSVAPASGSLLSFADPGGGHTDNLNDFPAGTSFAGITFAAGAPAFNLQGNAIQLSGPLVNQSNVNETIGLDLQLVAGGGTLDTGSGSMTIAGAISGSALTKVGDGSLVLSGENNYAGGTTVLDGTLVITTADSLPTGSDLTVGADAQVLIDSSSAAFETSSYVSVPEPGTLALLVVAAAGVAGVIRGRLKMLSVTGKGANNRIWKFGG